MNTLPFSPLTSREMADRVDHLWGLCGARCETAALRGSLDDLDVKRLLDLGRKSLDYAEALEARGGVA